MTPDQINALFQLGGSAAICFSIVDLHKKKYVGGISAGHVSFFIGWGLWNLFYYPSLDQMWSFLACVIFVLVQLLWVGQILFYKDRIKQ